MPTTQGTGGAGSPRVQRYRPASEFDDATLAQKREYWRTKKREQRAKLSEVKRERSKATNRGSKSLGSNAVHKTSMGLNSSASCSIAGSAPPLLKSDGSYQTNVGGAPVVLLKGKGSAVSYNQNHSVGEGGQNYSSANQKQSWFQRIKLNKVLPQFPTSSAGPGKGAMVCKMAVKSSPTGGAVIGTVTSAKPNGVLLNSGSFVPPVRVAVRASGSAPRQPQSGITILNGSSPVVSSQQHLATQSVSRPDAMTKTQVTVSVQPRPLTTNITTGKTIVTTQSAPVLVHKPGVRPRGMKVTPLGGKKSALVAAQGVRSINDTSATLETEEERAAKRRENWRIKKREQRAKQAARLTKASKRITNMEISLQKAELLPTVDVERPLSALSGHGQRQCVSRVSAPFISAGRLLKNARAVASIAVKRESDDSILAKLTAVNANQQTIQLRVENPQEAKATMQTGIASNIIGYKPAGEPSRRLPGPVQFANVSRGMVRCRTPRQRLIETQNNFLGQRNMRKSPCHAKAFTTHNAPRDDPTETPEQRAARKREYWRVKKREQRAKLSGEVRAKMKERDALMQRVKRYQSILEDMRKARAAGCNTLPQPTENRPTHTNASETIGGFIMEDGTLTNNIPQIDLTTEAKETGGEIGSSSGMPVNNSFTNINTHRQHQLLPKPTSDTSSNVVLSHQTQDNPPPPLIRSAQFKVSCPPVGVSIMKPPRLVSIRPRTEFRSTPKNLQNSHTVFQPQSHITLTHPQNIQNTFPGVPTVMPKPASCVMQMAVKASTASAVLNLDPKLTEEESMAKKREYWRVKKREQRAARAIRLRQGVQARGNAASQKRRNQRLARLATANPNVNTSVNHTLTIKPLSNTSVSTPPQGNQIKQERESISTDAPLEQPLCVDIKPSRSPPHPEPTDPALSADSQATTLLAVASMKKLLEESLSTVADCKMEQPDCITEQLPCKSEPQACSTEENAVQIEVKPNLPLLTLGDEEKASISGDLSLEVKGWQVDADAPPPCQVTICPLSPHPKDSPLSSPCTKTLSFSAPPLTLSEPPSHTPTHSCSHKAASGGPLLPLPRRAQRLRAKKAGHHNCCSPELPKLHHQPPQQQPPYQLQNQQQRQQQHQKQPQQQQQHQQHHHAPAVTDQNVTLQKKREYWRMMKRQQRARKARQGGGGLRQGDYSRRLALKAAQAPNLHIVKTQTQRPVQRGGSFSLQAAPFLKPQPSPLFQPISPPASGPQTSLSMVTNIPTLLVVSPTTSNIGQPSDTLQLKPPVNCTSISNSSIGHTGSPQTSHSFSTAFLPVGGSVTVPPLGEGKKGGLLLVESQQEAAPGSSPDSPRVRKWRLQVQESSDADTSPIATLTPPPNPLTSIKLLPIHPPSQTSTFTPTQTPFKCQGAQIPQSGNVQNVRLPTMQALNKSPIYISSMGPPKPVPGESEEETLRKKREYWRVKKKEQRARKAMRDRELTEKKASVNWRSILPSSQPQHLLQGLDTQEHDPDRWVNTSEDSELHLRTSTETDMGYFPDPSHTEPIEEESELLFPDGDHDDNYNGPISDAVWRNCFLMDYDPLNQLLVCMVCGEPQYSHSLEGVRAHIEEAHPDTLSLVPPERRHILEAWDEQVSRRELFFTSQLQQHSGATGGDSANLPAEVEVMVDTEDSSYLKNSKSSKTTKRL
ncbi:uncharacterized protein LOC121554503 [Coregonus clupeaformis]|uniref:uncharacterized protein LOC121554503 n=1 Tax=Coregonus clupeaformis TaxID=59861 RepID=UPI001BDF94D9|nr:uncharacterized protein LOC121554503 [Coregonus clupeaformis]XP_041724040.1 uncharacterized protein LOC121554503 [Coregonus clupeaformis]XP_041724041.1 uncharacterized protein LOC121554503 [Coregonus clupeaformis]XP_045070438.1 uncharacterized protein LOC121554503 [Coregonus clupeaformis]